MKKCFLLSLVAVAVVCRVFASLSGAEWISVSDAPVFAGPVKDDSRAASGTSWFVRTFTNSGEVVSAKWTVAGLGVFDVFVNGMRVGDDFLKPGYTHYAKTKYSFSYDVTALLKPGSGSVNILAAEVSAGWWRDKILTPVGHDGFMGRKSAFRGSLEIAYSDGRREIMASNTNDWKCAVAGAVTHAAIFDGEEYDARIKDPVLGEGLDQTPEINSEFKGEVLPTSGAEVTLRRDLAMVRGPFSLKKGETLVVDFGQNCAAVPEFRFSAKRGTKLTALPAEMLNDADKGVRGCDGPKGSVYRANLRRPNEGMRIVYTFAGEGRETYLPRFTFFGYRYLSLTATGDVEIESISSIPVTSIRKDMETGTLETGDKTLNRFIKNIYWGQLSNYLSVPTDCPQRNERLGWSADTQVFCEAGAFNADTRSFFRKFTRDLRDSVCKDGGYPSVAPFAQYGNETFSLGWADVGVIVPWTIWRQFGDTGIINDNWAAMSKFVRKIDEMKYDFEDKLNFIYADWLSYETFETCGNRFGSWKKWQKDPDAKNYRLYLAACYWLYDARLMSEMGRATGRHKEAEWFDASAKRALEYIRERFLEKDGLLLKPMRHLQTANLFALKHGIMEGAARETTKELLLKSIHEYGDCLQTGFLGTSFLMDALTECGMVDTAYTLLLQHKNPSWLYSVDQGATTVWERWNSYTKKDGFGPVDMNSFNHYAYGAVLAWMYRTMAGIAADSSAPGFKRIVMAPKPDRRLGWVKAEYKSVAGLVKSAWRYEGDEWIWTFTVPEGSIARVTVPGETKLNDYSAGVHTIRRVCK
ncbi:MAG: family 78 glycoside hydrolase catalytic domain [Kiritimatiellae bacterium]|nr:family 78 glycoside hydrolase catalytic domain [Kiritimatiellia bacterium]